MIPRRLGISLLQIILRSNLSIMSLRAYSTDVTRTFIHRTLKLPVDWLDFVTHLEHRLGRYNEVTLAAATNVVELQAAVDGMRGQEALSIYAIYDHGHLLNVSGKPTKGKQYVLGNSVFATTMTRHDFRVAQNAPVANLIWEESPGFTTIEFETADSMFLALSGGNEQVGIAARNVEEFRESLFLKVFEDCKAGRVGGNGL